MQNIDPENVPKEMNRKWLFWSYSGRSRLPIFRIGDMVTDDINQEWYLEPSEARNEITPRIQNDRIKLMDHYWRLAKGWLSECLSHHTRCKHVTSVEDYYPTRLIDVRVNNSDSELRLCSTNNGASREPYMTLSHCWGKAQFLRLTSLTHDRLQQGFVLAELPPTFRDAIMVTRALGVNFLWIDALCIIQDSIVDWQHEATMMSQVYSKSICNISALDAKDSTGGLFLDRETSNIPYCTFIARRKFQRKRFYELAYNDFWSDSVQYAPLTRRAWVLQERLLAPRVLHFGRRQLLWECNELRSCEIYPKGMPATNPIMDIPTSDKFLKVSLITVLQGGSDNASTSQMHGVWNDIVQHYTKCSLTMSKDKLVAISGIAKRLQPLFKTEYLAGLWRDDLLRQLLWHVDFHQGNRRYLAGEKRPEYRAPSWSWASIDAPIGHSDIRPEIVHMATITEAHVTPVTEDATGQVADGYVRLRAPLFPVNVGTYEHSDLLDLVWAWGKLDSLDETIPDVWPQPAVERLQFVPLLMTWHPPHFEMLVARIYGLLPKPVDGKQGVYRRWGMLRHWGDYADDVSNFGVQLTKGQQTYRYDPREGYPEQVITLI